MHSFLKGSGYVPPKIVTNTPEACRERQKKERRARARIVTRKHEEAQLEFERTRKEGAHNASHI